MVKYGCYNGELDTTNYSDPTPAIGVYIAVFCLVCFFSIVFDIYYSIRRRKLCMPSKFFTPNSFNMMVISVATKIPGDLNKAMPRAIDQLSKLTSSCFLFISLGLFMTSLGRRKLGESIEKMAALTVLVITVVVDMCIQMFTGVIFAFTIEHWVVLSCTVILLAFLWSSTLTLDFLKDYWGVLFNENNPSQLTIKGMGKHIKELYAISYSLNPQLFMCGTPICSAIGVLCAIVSLVLLEAILSFIFLEVGIGPSTIKDRRFCEKESDYKWSIWCVVVTQIITIVVGSFTLVARWLLPLSHMSLSFSKARVGLKMREFMWKGGLQKQMILPLPFELKNGIIALLTGLQKSMALASDLVVFLCLGLRKAYKNAVSLYCKDGGPKESNFNSNENWNVVTYFGQDHEFREWLKKGFVHNIEGWVRESKNDDLTHLIKNLSKFPPPQSAQALLHHISNYRSPPLFDFTDYNLSCFSILVLAKYAAILDPSPWSDSLIESVKEAFELIYFIDKKMNTKSAQNKLRWKLAKSMWLNMGISNNYLEKNIIAPIFKEGSHKMQGIDRFWLIVNAFTGRRGLEDDLFTHLLYFEFEVIGDWLLDKRDASVVELQECIERTIAELLHLFLKYLPIALHKEYSEISLEGSEEKLSRALKYFCILEILEEKLKDHKVSWEWPDETLLKKKKKNYLYSGETTDSDDSVGETAVSHEVEGGVVSGSEHVVAIGPADSNITPIAEGEIIEEIGGG